MRDALRYSPPDLDRTKRRRAAAESVLNRHAAGNKRSLYFCTYCQRDISSQVRIKCAECADVDLCVDCFSVGVELHPHKNTHPYRVIDASMGCPIFDAKWGADEEVLLLEALCINGPGSWQHISEHVGTKGPEDCRRHYLEVYMSHPGAPLPHELPSLATVDVTKPVEATPYVEVKAEEPPSGTVQLNKWVAGLECPAFLHPPPGRDHCCP